MRSKTRLKQILFCAGTYVRFALAAVLCAGGLVFADWEAGDPALHYQTPDESDGWSVYGDGGGDEPLTAADDWTAAATAAIKDIFFWGGWENDYVGETGDILIRIFGDNPAGQKPGECVWSRVIPEGQYTARLYQSVSQNFSDPRFADKWDTQDHYNLYQYSVANITNPFMQQAGQTYWLAISTDVQGGNWGWNTAESVSGGPAVFGDENNDEWAQLLTPAGYQDPSIPMDMAFVLTPEPATLLLLGLGAVAIRKRRNQEIS